MTSTLTHRTVTAAGLRSQLSGSDRPRLLDVRTPGEFQGGHIPGSVNVPLDQLGAHAARLAGSGGGSLVLVCQSGGRANQAADTLAGAGAADLTVLESGMNAWTAAGAPVDSAEAADRWALERQVRLVAGGIVVSSILGSIWKPRLRFVAGGIGAGLVFAAVSNTCTMGRVLMKLPYNRHSDADVRAAVDQLTR